MLLIILLCSLLTWVEAESQLRVLHRVYLPVKGPSPFFHRGTLWLSGDYPVFVPSEPQLAEQLRVDEPGALYQVALERDGDSHEIHWDISSVNAVGPAPQSYGPSHYIYYS